MTHFAFLFKPGRHLRHRQLTARHGKGEVFQVGIGGDKTPAIAFEKEGGGITAAAALIAINKGMVAHQRFQQGRSLAHEVRIEILTAKGGLGLGDGRGQQTQVADARAATRLGDKTIVDKEHLGGSQLGHRLIHCANALSAGPSPVSGWG